MAENQVYLIKSGSNSFIEETEAVVGISGGKLGIGTTHPEADLHVTGSVKVGGDLAVDGTFTTINSSTVSVDDKNIELGSTENPTDATADGGGITVKGTSHKTFNWSGNNSAWTSSEHLYLANGKHFSADELRALRSDGLKLADATTSGVLIKGGKVGIHQATPAYDLDVDGSGNFTSLYVDGNAVLTGEGSIFGKWEDGATQGEIYYTGGNVGVGTDNPEYPFHVFGNSVVDGNFIVNGESGNLNVSKFNISGDSITLNYRGGALASDRGGLIVKDSNDASKSFEYVGGASDFWLSSENIKIADGKELQTDKVRAIDGDGLYLHDDAGNGIFVKDGGNVGIKNITPSVALDVSGSAKISADLNVVGYVEAQDLKFTTINGDSATSQNDIIAWNATNDAWEVKAASQLGLGAGGSSSEVPESIESSVTQGATQMQVNYGPFDTVPKVSATLEIDGDGPIIPFAISGVSNSSYNVIFAQEVPNSNYSIHTVFGGYDVHWRTGDDASISYTPGSVYIDKDLTVSGDLFVQGNQTIINTTKLDVEDKNITIAKNIASTDDTMVDAGITWGSDNVVKMLYSKNKGFSFNGGDVGIGTTSPSEKLQVNGNIVSVGSNITVTNGGSASGVGIYSPVSNEMGLSANGLEAIRIDSDGNVGIGHTNPGGKLHVSDLSVSIGNVTVTNSGPGVTDGTDLNTKISDGDRIKINGEIFTVSNVAATTLTLNGTPSTANTYPAYTDSNGLIVTSAGNVGIGTTNPDALLDVEGSLDQLNSATIKNTSSTGYGFMTMGGGNGATRYVADFRNKDNVSCLKIDGNGKVGIGTTNPDKNFEVAGNIRATKTSVDGRDLALDLNVGGSADHPTLDIYDKDGNDGARITANGNSWLSAKGGNVGIGTTNPGKPLHIAANAHHIALEDTNGTVGSKMVGIYNNNQQLHLGRYNDDDFNDFTTHLFINATGNVGIGTTNPGGKLHVTELSASIGNVTVTNSGPEVTGGTDLDTKISNGDRIKINNEIFIVSNVQPTTLTLNGTPSTANTYPAYTDSNGLIVTSAGNVGIGTTNPDYDLDVHGWINAQADALSADAVINLAASNADNYGAISRIKSTSESDSNGASSLTFSTRDSDNAINERMRIDSSGNVGIGTTNPGEKLHIEGSSPSIKIKATNQAGLAEIKLQTDAGDQNDDLWSIRASNHQPADSHLLEFMSYSTGELVSALAIKSNGNVGIGTTSPGYKLDVHENSDTGWGARIINDSTANEASGLIVRCNGGSSGDAFRVHSNSEEFLRVKNNGNVGIGTTDPGTNKLDVQGTLSVGATATSTSAGYIKLQGYRNASDQGILGHVRFDNQNEGNTAGKIEVYAGGSTTTGTMRFHTSGSEKMRIAANDNVGIGTTSPSGSLHVNTVSLSIGSVTVTDDGGDPPVVSTQITGTALNTKISNGDRIKINNEIFTVSDVQSTTLTLSGTPSTAGTYEAFTDNNGLIVTSAGNVGIGTTDPLSKFVIKGGTDTTASSFEVNCGNNSVVIDALQRDNNNTPSPIRYVAERHLFLGSAGGSGGEGNVGIGTTNPLKNLEVGGTGEKVIRISNATGQVDLITRSDGDFEIINNYANGHLELHVQTSGRIKLFGDTIINGSLSKTSGSFKIDHPLPEKSKTHDLVHSFVEAPQADNIYRGKTELVGGTAEVNIDLEAGMTEGTFVLLNREVQVFTSNESDWDAVRGKVEGNKIIIECQNNESTATVSWLVIGERHDQHMFDTKWTDENGKVIVEPEKLTIEQ